MIGVGKHQKVWIIMKTQYRKNWILLAGLAVYYGIGFGVFVSCFGLFLQPMSISLDVPYVLVSSASTIRMLAGTVTTSLSGRVLPRVNFRLFISLNTVLLAVGAALTALAQNVGMLYFASLLMGIGAGFGIYTIVPTVLNRWFQRPSPYIGIATSVGAAMGIFASVGISWLITAIGWRGAYWAIVLMLLCISLPISIFILRFNPADAGAQVYPADGHSPAADVQTSLQQGLTNREARRTVVYFLLAAAFVVTSLLSGRYSQISTALYAIGHPGIVVGIITACYQVGTTVYNLALGALCSRFPAAHVMSVATLTVALGGLGLMLAAQSPIVVLAVFSFLLGGGRSLENVCGPAIVRRIFGPRDCGSIFSDLHAVMLVFSSFTAVLYGQIYTATQSYNGVYLIMLAAAVLVVLLLQAARRKGKAMLSARTA